MYKHLLFLGFLLVYKNNFGQVPGDWSAFSQRIDAKPYIGKNFRLEAAVKVKAIDSTAEGEIWVRVDKPNKKIGFFYNMMDKPIRLNEWKVYSIKGKIELTKTLSI
ncbi:MAG: hypothetical protein WKF59_13310 [Chitinophagaceae bacterium]